MTTIGVVAIPTAAQANISSECVCIHGVAMQSDDWAVLIGFFTSVKDSATQKNQTTVGAWANKLIGHCARSYNKVIYDSLSDKPGGLGWVSWKNLSLTVASCEVQADSAIFERPVTGSRIFA